MLNTNNFLKQLKQINWFENSGTSNDEYLVVNSIFEAYDGWNQQMLDTWEPHICALEAKAQEMKSDAWIDEIFDMISNTINNNVWEKWSAFIERCNLQEESGLDNEMIEFVVRDIAWACIEDSLDEQGFFTEILDIYKKGYFPCSWSGTYPDGKPVVL